MLGLLSGCRRRSSTADRYSFLEHLGRHVRLSGRKGGWEIAHRFALARAKSAFDLKGQDRLGPSKPQGLGGVPEPGFRIAQSLQKGDVLAPRNLCNGALHNCRVRPSRGKCPHVLQVFGGQPLHLRKGLAQIRR